MYKVVKKVFFSLFLALFLTVGSGASAFEPERLIRVNLNFEDGMMSLAGADIYEGFATKSSLNGTYKYSLKMFSNEGTFLTEKDFSVGSFLSINCGEEENCDDEGGVLNSLRTNVVIPYDNSAVLVILFDANGRFIEKMDIAPIVNFCGNGVCGEGESFENCKTDCSVVKEEKVDEAPVLEDEIISETNVIKYLIIGISVAVLIALVWMIYWYMHKNKHPEDSVPSDPNDIDNW